MRATTTSRWPGTYVGRVAAASRPKANIVAELVADQANWRDATTRSIAKREAMIKGCGGESMTGTGT
jgi:hypothetical protein